jgi:ABC-type antimicrobial peptide transport system permease subunit
MSNTLWNTYHDYKRTIQVIIRYGTFDKLLNYVQFDLEHMMSTTYLGTNMLFMLLTKCRDPTILIHVLDNLMSKPDLLISSCIILLTPPVVVNHALDNKILSLDKLTLIQLLSTYNSIKEKVKRDDRLYGEESNHCDCTLSKLSDHIIDHISVVQTMRNCSESVSFFSNLIV